MRLMKKLVALGLCVAMAAALTACKSEETFNWSQLSDVNAPPTAAPSTESQVLNVSMPEASGELNPFTNPSQGMQGLMRLCYEGLMRLSDRYQPENWLAESVVRTEDGFTVTLRAGVLFHDGKGLTAADVAYSFNAIRQAEDSPWADVIAPIEELRADGERVVNVKTSAGYAALYALTFPVVNKDTEGDLFAGTGPYCVEGYVKGESLDLIRWESWWRTPARIPAVHAMAREDAESVLNTFVTGSLDVCMVDMLTVSSVTQRSYVRKQEALSGQAELLLPNLARRLSDAQLRQVVALALDGKDVIANTYQNHGVSVDVPVLPDSWLSERAGGVEHDADAARALLEKMGWKDLDGDGYVERYASGLEDEEPEEDALTGDAEHNDAVSELLGGTQQDPADKNIERLTLTILTNEEDTSRHKDAAGRIAAQLNAVGIRTEVESVSFGELDKAAEGQWDLLLCGYQLPDTGNLRSLLGSDGENNRMGYASAEMDEALAALDAALTAESYYAAMQRVYDLIVRDMPVYTVCMRTRTQVTGENVTVPGVIRESEPYRGIENWTNIE